MSAGEVDIIVKAQDNASASLSAIQQKVMDLATAQGSLATSYADARSEINTQQRSISTLTNAYREQYESVYLAGRAFSDLSSIVQRVLNMYQQYNVAMIRQNQIQKEVTTAQQAYNDAITKYGEGSSEAASKLSELTSAQEALATNTERVNAMLVAFVVQIPSFIGPIMNTAIAFKILSVNMAAATIPTATEIAAMIDLSAAEVAAATAAGTEGSALMFMTQAEFDAISGTTALTGATTGLGASFLAILGPIAAVVAAVLGFYEVVQVGREIEYKFTPAIIGARDALFELEGGASRARMGIKDSIPTTQQAADAAEAQAKALQNQVDEVIRVATGQMQLNDTTKELTAQYANGSLTMAQFAEAMLKAGVSITQTETIIENTVSASKSAFQNFVAQATQDASAFKDAWTGAFATLGPDLSSTLATMTADINTAITSGFIGQAQSLFQQFTDCVSGKMNDLPGMQQQTMDSIVTITNEAINKGLQGTAQEGIAAFVKCSTNKQAAMVDEINGYLIDLQQKYADNNEKIKILTENGRTDEAKIYEKANEDIKATVSQLMDWLDGIVSGKPLDIPLTVSVDTAQAKKAIDDAIAGTLAFGSSPYNKGAGAVSTGITVKVDTSQALADIAKVQTALDNLTSKVTIKIDFDEKSAQTALTSLTTTIAAIKPITELIPGLQGATETTVTLIQKTVVALRSLHAEIEDLPGAKTIDIKADTNAAKAALIAIQAMIDALRGKTVIISIVYVISGMGGGIVSLPGETGYQAGFGDVSGIFGGGNYPGPENLGLTTIGGHYQFGGIVPEDMLAYVHRGEEVIPANQVASGRSSTTPSPINFQNQTFVQVDGETVQRAMETRMIRSRQVGSRYGV